MQSHRGETRKIVDELLIDNYNKIAQHYSLLDKSKWWKMSLKLHDRDEIQI